MRILVSSALAAILALSTACKGDPAPAPAPAPAPTAAPATPGADAAPAPTGDTPPAPTGDTPPAPTGDTPPAPTGDAPAADLSAEQNAIIEKGVVAFEDMSKLLGAGKDDCDKLGEDLKSFMEKNGDALKAFRTTMEALSPAQQEASRVKYEKRMEASMEGFMQGGMSCQTNAKVREAMTALTGEPMDAPDMPEMPDLENAKAETPVVGKLAEIVKASGDDCAKLGKNLEPFVASDLPDLKAFVTKMQATEQPPMNGDMLVLMQALPKLQQCESEASVQAIKNAFVGGEQK